MIHAAGSAQSGYGPVGEYLYDFFPRVNGASQRVVLPHPASSRCCVASRRVVLARELRYEVQTNFIFEAASILLHSRIHLSLLRHDRRRPTPVSAYKSFRQVGNKRRVLMDLRATSIFPLSRLILFARQHHKSARNNPPPPLRARE